MNLCKLQSTVTANCPSTCQICSLSGLACKGTTMELGMPTISYCKFLSASCKLLQLLQPEPSTIFNHCPNKVGTEKRLMQLER